MLWRMWRKRNTLPLLVGLQTGTTTLEISLEVLHKIRNRSTWRPSYTLGIYPKDAPPNHRDTCSIIFIPALLVIIWRWKQPKCPTTEELIQKMLFIYIMEYYSDIKNEDILSFAGNWIELESIILNEVIQTPKDMHGMYSLISGY